jgi:hypothetical protein
MPSYELTKIYKITNDINDKIYIGSTTLQYLCSRLNGHKQNTKDNSNRRNSPMNNEMRLLGVEHFKIELIEKFPCSNKKEMVEKEQYYIDLLKPQLNKFRAIEDPDFEKKRYIRDKDKRLLLSKNNYNKNKEKISEQGKQYREANKEKISEQRKQYREANKEKIAERKKKYREANKEKIAEQKKKYSEANKEKIAEKNKVKFTCECGSICRISDKSSHLKSNKHTSFIKIY